MKTKIAIIGGGMAGLGVAYELSSKDCEITLFEKGKVLGGLASSFEANGVPIENFYHHMFPTYFDFWEIAPKLGIEKNDLF